MSARRGVDVISGVVAAGGCKDAAKMRGFLARAGAALKRERTATQGSLGGSTTLRGLRRERPMGVGASGAGRGRGFHGRGRVHQPRRAARSARARRPRAARAVEAELQARPRHAGQPRRPGWRARHRRLHHSLGLALARRRAPAASELALLLLRRHADQRAADGHARGGGEPRNAAADRALGAAARLAQRVGSTPTPASPPTSATPTPPSPRCWATGQQATGAARPSRPCVRTYARRYNAAPPAGAPASAGAGCGLRGRAPGPPPSAARGWSARRPARRRWPG